MGLHKKRIENIILQDFNMVKRKSGLQTNLEFDTLLRLNKSMSYGN